MRFWRKVRKVGGCWEWQGARHSFGYGQMRIDGKLVNLHRWIYEQVFGEIAPGLEVMHSCDNPRCVRPAHLSLGTHLENMQDARRKGRTWIRARATHCKRGHEFTPENTAHGKKGRKCRECSNAARRIVGGRGAYRRRAA